MPEPRINNKALLAAIQQLSTFLRRMGGVLIMGLLVAGCPHYNAGLPPSLRLPSLQPANPISGVYHTIAPGETLGGIARAYKVERQRLAEVNNLSPPYLLKVDGRLFIPGASHVKRVDPRSEAPADESRVNDFSGTLGWPLDGDIVSEFGVRRGILHNGIEISAEPGTPVRAAGDGRVGYVGNIKGYGNVVIIEHAKRLLTVYAHLQNTSAEKGKRISRGHLIGTVGKSGSEGKSSLYFEVRSRSKPRNPRFFLARRS
ncbi:MAG: LysM peptidoglycan-binding domain-containing M23 family metallopeptidase [Deltaproteobacteria bacterium]